MTAQTVHLELPAALFERVSAQAPDAARDLVTFLMEDYAQDLEKTLRQQAYETYYAARTPEEEAEEQEILADFAPENCPGYTHQPSPLPTMSRKISSIVIATGRNSSTL